MHLSGINTNIYVSTANNPQTTFCNWSQKPVAFGLKKEISQLNHNKQKNMFSREKSTFSGNQFFSGIGDQFTPKTVFQI